MAPFPDPKAKALPEALPEEPKKNVPSALSLLGKVLSLSTLNYHTPETDCVGIQHGNCDSWNHSGRIGFL